MICARCLRRASAPGPSPSPSLRNARQPPLPARPFSSTARPHAQQPLSGNTAQTSQPQRATPAATSTAAAQPFSARDTPTPKVSSTPEQPGKARPQSSVPAGTPLKGLNYFKNRDDPLAKADDEYPAWLWDVLAAKKQPAGAAPQQTDPRVYSKSANARRKANRRVREQQALRAAQEQEIPVYEQSVDLGGAADARLGLSRAMRDKRRRDIKEANFLTAMR